MNGHGEEERGNEAPEPLRRSQSGSAKCNGASGVGLARRTPTGSPPQVHGEKYHLGNRSERRAKLQEKERPHVGGNKANKQPADDGPQRNWQFRPSAGRGFVRGHGDYNCLVVRNRSHIVTWISLTSMKDSACEID